MAYGRSWWLLSGVLVSGCSLNMFGGSADDDWGDDVIDFPDARPDMRREPGPCNPAAPPGMQSCARGEKWTWPGR